MRKRDYTNMMDKPCPGPSRLDRPEQDMSKSTRRDDESVSESYFPPAVDANPCMSSILSS